MSSYRDRRDAEFESRREREATGERDEETDEERDERERQETIADDHAWEETKARRHGASDD